MRLPFDPGSTPLVFTNTTDEECPPHAVLACHGFSYDADTRVLSLRCRRPTSDDIESSTTTYVFNGPTKVGVDKIGACVLARHAPQWAKMDPSLTYAELTGDEFTKAMGPVADQWYLSDSNDGFIFVGARDDSGNVHLERALVIERPATAGGPPIVMFQIVELVTLTDDFCGVAVARAVVLSRPVGVSRVEGEDYNGYITVRDMTMTPDAVGGCFFNEPPGDLVDRIGFAVYLESGVLSVCSTFEPKQWHCISLCCLPEACGEYNT